MFMVAIALTLDRQIASEAFRNQIEQMPEGCEDRNQQQSITPK